MLNTNSKIGISSNYFLVLKTFQVILWINGLLQWDFSKPKSSALWQIALTDFVVAHFPRHLLSANRNHCLAAQRNKQQAGWLPRCSESHTKPRNRENPLEQSWPVYPIYNSITLMFKSISNQPGPTAEGNRSDNSSSVFMQVLDVESGVVLITSSYIWP